MQYGGESCQLGLRVSRTKAEAVKSRSEEQLVKDPLSLSQRGSQNKYYAETGGSAICAHCHGGCQCNFETSYSQISYRVADGEINILYKEPGHRMRSDCIECLSYWWSFETPKEDFRK